jgi:hypothetical protein
MIAVEKKKVVNAGRHTDKEEGVTDQSGRVRVPSETEGKESLRDVIGVFFFKGGLIEYVVIEVKGNPKRKGKCILKRIGERIDHITDGKKSDRGIMNGIKVEKEMRNRTIGKDSIEETECSKERKGCNDRGPHALFRGGGSSQFFRGTKGPLFGSAKGALFLGGAEGATAACLRIQIGNHCSGKFFTKVFTGSYWS